MVQTVSILQLYNIFYKIDLYAIFELVFSIFLYIIISRFLFKQNNNNLILIEKICFYSFLISLFVSFIINPGIPKREYYSKKFEKEYKGNFATLKKCDKCNITIPGSFKVGHCVFCNICVKNYDHHCPWIGKCVARYTLIPFYIFLLSILCYIICSILLFINSIKKYF